MAGDTAFREDIRRWLEENCPASMRTPMATNEYPGGGRRAKYRNPDTKVWLERMAERGFTVPMWPRRYGGGGLDKDENAVLQEELRLINARPAHVGMGISMIGPALLEYGTEEQKTEHLPKIARGEIWWCQGYSEPNAGSDLASLRTQAVEDGDDYIVNGQKVWTSGADNADWMFCLVRTDADASKHEGITFILFDMATAGVSVKPILLISGLSPFCETFLDDVRVPRKNVVSEVNKGWTVAKRLLQYERTSIGGIGGGTQRSATLEEVAARYVGLDNGMIADSVLRANITRHRMNDSAYALTMKRSLEESASGRAPGAVSSMFKYYGTEQNKGRYELLLSIMGTQSLGWGGESFDGAELETARAWLRSKANSIEGGTSEVQLNILAKRVLGLPD
ncbi:MAG: acyl-CoA dehydrogenase family protein [Gammaproteobacteria bacterium]|nr:acyl-CoA dehydrogenase family protein [Gammaproteobacteria bacterium]